MDTNQLHAVPLDGQTITLLRALAAAKGEPLTLSSLVLAEDSRKYRTDLVKLYEKLARVQQELRRMRTGTENGAPPFERSGTVDQVLIDSGHARRTTRLLEIFEILDLGPKDALEGLRREVERIAPASTDLSRQGAGARDAAIWVSLLGYARDRKEDLLFVTADKAFHTEEVVKEAQGKGVTAHVLQSISGLLDHLADPVSHEHVDPALLKNDSAIAEIRAALDRSSELSQAVHQELHVPGTAVWKAESIADGLRLAKVVRSSKYQVVDTSWTVADTLWNAINFVNLTQVTWPAGRDQDMSGDWQFEYTLPLTLLLRSDGSTTQVEVTEIGMPTDRTVRRL